MLYLEKIFLLFRKDCSLIHFHVALEEHSKASTHNSAASPVKTSTVKSNTILIQVKLKQMMYTTGRTSYKWKKIGKYIVSITVTIQVEIHMTWAALSRCMMIIIFDSMYNVLSII